MILERHEQVFSIIKVPAIPPGVNNYVRHTRNGIHYITREAQAFKELLAASCVGVDPVHGHEFEVEITVMLGKGERGDVDNFPKLVLDTIGKIGLFRDIKTGKKMSDAHVTRLTVTKERGEESRTVIEIVGVQTKS
ncbi:MAG TPA: hypothetical protein VMW51_10375 [Terriglobia bacterium]|nr:hypothetical protein [Terriglobia bacterium]